MLHIDLRATGFLDLEIQTPDAINQRIHRISFSVQRHVPFESFLRADVFQATTIEHQLSSLAGVCLRTIANLRF